MLDPRAKKLLKTLVERHIVDGQPIGSRTLSHYSSLELSSATIRNILAQLEHLGFVESRHASSGRVPTPRGYRLFVEMLMTAESSFDAKPFAKQVASRFQAAESKKQIVASAAQVLSNLSQFVSVVLAPRKSQTFRQIEFLRLSEKRILLIIVTPEGDVQNRVVVTPEDYSASALIEVANYLNQHYSGKSFNEISALLRREIDSLLSDMSVLMQAVVETGEHVNMQDEVLISGERNLLEVSELSSDLDRLRKLFAIFDEKTRLLRLLDASSYACGVPIFIGGESDFAPYEDMTVVTAPYQAQGKIVGTLGVIGPMRMAYERVIPIVDGTARLLSSILNQ